MPQIEVPVEKKILFGGFFLQVFFMKFTFEAEISNVVEDKFCENSNFENWEGKNSRKTLQKKIYILSSILD